MFKKYAIIVLVIAGMMGCKSKSAFNFSENIVAKEKSLVPDIQATEKKVERFINAEQYDSIATAGANMEALVQTKIDEIEAMHLPDANGADNFKNASLRYFMYIKKMYTAYKDWGNAKTEEDKENTVK